MSAVKSMVCWRFGILQPRQSATDIQNSQTKSHNVDIKSHHLHLIRIVRIFSSKPETMKKSSNQPTSPWQLEELGHIYWGAQPISSNRSASSKTRQDTLEVNKLPETQGETHDIPSISPHPHGMTPSIQSNLGPPDAIECDLRTSTLTSV